MKKKFDTNENDFLTIWFNKEKKEEYFKVMRLELGDMVKVSLDKNKIYNIIDRLPNKSIKKYKLKNKEISKILKKRPYVEKIGLMLINFLNTDFSDFDKSFDNFYSIYGYEFLYKYAVYKKDENTYRTEEEAYNCIKELHKKGVREIIKIQDNYKKAVDFIFHLDDNENYDNFSSKAKFYACLLNNKYNFKKYSSNIKVKLMINKYEGSSEADIDTILTKINYNPIIVSMIEKYFINNLKVLFFIILYQLVINDFVIKRCQICKKYFVPTKLSELYCDFINEDSNTTCRKIGAFQVYKKNIESIPGLLEYRRAYNKKSNEVSRNKQNTKLKEDFEVWKKLAQKTIKDYKHGELTQEELYKWMIENK